MTLTEATLAPRKTMMRRPSFDMAQQPRDHAAYSQRGIFGEAHMQTTAISEVPDLAISPEKACFIIVKAREFDVKDAVTNPGESSSAADDAMSSVLEDRIDDPVAQELRSFIGSLNEDEQIDLVALTWLGRGDGTVADWDEIRAEASRAHNKRTAAYLLGNPLLADYLEEGLSQLGLSCDEFEIGRL